MAAPYIVAQPGTLTGSIGVITGKFVTGGVYEKLGANIDGVSFGKHARDRLAGASLHRRRSGRRSSR